MIRAAARAIVLAAALAAAAPAAASAGTYDVAACGAAAGPAQNAFAASADPGMAAYTICPNTPSNPASGLVTRASITAGRTSVPYFSGAYQVFEAPPGASLQSVSFDLAAIRLSSSWTTGIVAYDGDFNRGDLPYGCYGGNPGCGIGSTSFFGPVSVGLGGHSRFRFETRCVSTSGCDISSTGYQPAMRALFSAANVTVRVQDSTPPQVMPASGGLFSGSWLRGEQTGWSIEQDNVGIMVNRARVDGRVIYEEDFRNAGWPDWVRCNFTRPAPCASIPAPGAASRVDTKALADGEHELRVEAVDAAGNTGAITRRFAVDNSAPGRVDAVVDGGEDWRRANTFDLRWAQPAGQAAPITVAHYRVCSTDGGKCAEGTQAGADIAKLSEIRAPGPGDYVLEMWLEDAAGNQAGENASRPVHLRFDGAPPEQAEFELLDEDDPRRVDVLVSDSTSGVRDGVIEIRRSGHRQWHALPTSLSGGNLSAYLDDLSLEDGVYDLRAIVHDRAGNERIGDRRRDGAPMQLALPLRDATRLSIERSAARIRGRLETARGRPLAGADVHALEQPRTGGGFRPLASLRTDDSGGFALKLRRGPSRTLRLVFEGNRLVRPAAAAIAIRVPATTTIRVSRRSLRNGGSVRFRGRLGGGTVPAGGKLIDLQAHYRGRWRTFANPRADRHGRWGFRYRFEATRGVVTYSFRAVVRREAAYPYELGRSRVVRVRVRGP